ncbi:STAS domain-containing protein [Actinacidiphila oryziradicis]|uniref:Anti-sigma factor antagonist n=1 Tax=Actinacidiphila oryziradicis TaxID=2571141 RepID=A0A4U0SHQ9_9ACTN|nr:STAS domain-containing protein [Actinacidiphila oryziradicis]MCW2871577.1 anti-anti-sigma factor [Actinacidiphila oryziradicis]TKA09224.1 STAS domain-containing protein [Actinacidiphila oryziradicis]
MSTRLVVLPANREQDEQVVLELTGELDLDSEGTLAAVVGAVLESGRPWIVLDCTGLAFCDSRGMNALLTVQRSAQAAGGALVLAAIGGHVRQVLALAGVDQVIPTAAGVDEGIGLLAAIRADVTPDRPGAAT